VLEMSRQDDSGELERVPDDEAKAGGAPGDDGVESGVIDEVEGLGQKGRNRVHLQNLQGLGRVVIGGVHCEEKLRNNKRGLECSLEGKKGVIKRVRGRWRVEEWRWQRRAIAQ